MTLEEAGKKISMDVEDLQMYEKQGIFLLENMETEKAEQEIEEIRTLDSLAKIGVGEEELRRLKTLMGRGHQTSREQIRLLKKCRFDLLDDIHGKQKKLDKMDYMIHIIKEKERNR